VLCEHNIQNKITLLHAVAGSEDGDACNGFHKSATTKQFYDNNNNIILPKCASCNAISCSCKVRLHLEQPVSLPACKELGGFKTKRYTKTSYKALILRKLLSEL